MMAQHNFYAPFFLVEATCSPLFGYNSENYSKKNFHYFACMETLIYHVIQYKFFLLINNRIVLNNSI